MAGLISILLKSAEPSSKVTFRSQGALFRDADRVGSFKNNNMKTLRALLGAVAAMTAVVLVVLFRLSCEECV